MTDDRYLVPEDHPYYAEYQAAILNAVYAVCIKPFSEVVSDLCGYDPQLLLTDQRSQLRRLADHFAHLNPKEFAAGGFVKFLPHQRPLVEAFDRGEIFLPSGYRAARLSRFIRPGATQPETRVEPITRIYQFKVPTDAGILEALGRKVEVWDEIARRAAEIRQRHFYETALGVPYEPSSAPRWTEGHDTRLRRLLRSPDRRQRKRGARLAKQAYRRVYGCIWDDARYRK